jgi:hypothetical protein
VWRVAGEWAAESLAQRRYRRFPFPVLRLQPDDLQGAVVDRRFNAARMLCPRRRGRTSPWFNPHVHRQRNDLARRLDQYAGVAKLRDRMTPRRRAAARSAHAGADGRPAS